MKNKYSVKELSNILGCSVTAVSKKLKVDPKNPNNKLYRDEFETVVENNITYILLSDEDLEAEKSRSRGFNKRNKQVEPVIIENENKADLLEEKLYNFTKNYLNDFATLQQRYQQQLNEKDKQLYLLTTSEEQKKTEFLELSAKNKTLSKRYEIMKIVLTSVSTTAILLIILLINAMANVK